MKYVQRFSAVLCLAVLANKSSVDLILPCSSTFLATVSTAGYTALRSFQLPVLIELVSTEALSPLDAGALVSCNHHAWLIHEQILMNNQMLGEYCKPKK